MENIDNEIDLVIKQLSFNTHIGLDGLFPRQIISSDTCLTDNLDVGNAPSRSGAFVHFCKVGEADIGNPVVTYRTIRSSYFKIVEPGERLLYKFVAGRYPAQCDGWEETVLSAGLEVFGTGVSEVDVQQVSILVAISKPAGYSLIAQGNGR